MTGEDITRAAFTDFDHWQKHQSPDLLENMPLIQQASYYGCDDDWHNRVDDVSYDFRNN